MLVFLEKLSAVLLVYFLVLLLLPLILVWLYWIFRVDDRLSFRRNLSCWKMLSCMCSRSTAFGMQSANEMLWRSTAGAQSTFHHFWNKFQNKNNCKFFRKLKKTFLLRLLNLSDFIDFLSFIKISFIYFTEFSYFLGWTVGFLDLSSCTKRKSCNCAKAIGDATCIEWMFSYLLNVVTEKKFTKLVNYIEFTKALLYWNFNFFPTLKQFFLWMQPSRSALRGQRSCCSNHQWVCQFAPETQPLQQSFMKNRGILANVGKFQSLLPLSANLPR